MRYNQLRAMFAITRASLKAIMRSPSAVIFSFVFPFIFILVFGFVGNSGGRQSYKNAIRACFAQFQACCLATYSWRFKVLYPCFLTSSSRSAALRSSRTISATNSLKVILGVQPSFSRAFEGSPNRVSTSVGRK